MYFVIEWGIGIRSSFCIGIVGCHTSHFGKLVEPYHYVQRSKLRNYGRTIGLTFDK